MTAQDPGAATGQQPYEPGDYQKCPACFADLGKPCLSMSGWHLGTVVVLADRPHAGRKLRAGAVSR